ncbi:hypothetical protein NK214_06555 [Chromobacterium sp. S0633]|uniref:hypothetical protein n=1 Tax=Chromobacterium sp. S0633 TaxID=2957805 RepID=UPI0020A04442|nr:hypothetical protein [Chromobacterium sp. S0633]MCP1289850.1 hypothetical protein [Chromobacterium sp. S0633]
MSQKTTATLKQIGADIAANLQSSMAEIQQRMEKIDGVITDLRAAGVELEIYEDNCHVTSFATRRAYGSVILKVTNHASASIVKPICEKHGGDWFEPDTTVLSTMYEINVHIYGVNHSAQDTAA